MFTKAALGVFFVRVSLGFFTDFTSGSALLVVLVVLDFFKTTVFSGYTRPNPTLLNFKGRTITQSSKSDRPVGCLKYSNDAKTKIGV